MEVQTVVTAEMEVELLELGKELQRENLEKVRERYMPEVLVENLVLEQLEPQIMAVVVAVCILALAWLAVLE